MPFAYVADNTPGAPQAADTLAAWAAMPQADLDTLHARWTPDALVCVEGTLFVASVTDVSFQIVNAVRHAPLHTLEEVYLPVLSLAPGALSDLSRGVAPHAWVESHQTLCQRLDEQGRTLGEQAAVIATQEATIAQLNSRIEALAAQRGQVMEVRSRLSTAAS